LTEFFSIILTMKNLVERLRSASLDGLNAKGCWGWKLLH